MSVFVGDEPPTHTTRSHCSVVAIGGDLLIKGTTGRATLEEFRVECAWVDVDTHTTVPITLSLDSGFMK